MRPGEVKCGACGAVNHASRLFCGKCGERLDPAKLERALRHAGAGEGCAARLGRWARRLALWAVIAGLALALWPVGREASAGTAVDARRYSMQRAMLSEALDRGAAERVEVSERDVNAFLARHVQDSGEGGSWAARYRGAGVRFGEGEGEAWIEMSRGPLRLSEEWRWSTEGGTLRVTGARFGHLPLPGALGRWYARTQRGLWETFAEERRILEAAAEVKAAGGSLAVRVEGK